MPLIETNIATSALAKRKRSLESGQEGSDHDLSTPSDKRLNNLPVKSGTDPVHLTTEQTSDDRQGDEDDFKPFGPSKRRTQVSNKDGNHHWSKATAGQAELSKNYLADYAVKTQHNIEEAQKSIVMSIPICPLCNLPTNPRRWKYIYI